MEIQRNVWYWEYANMKLFSKKYNNLVKHTNSNQSQFLVSKTKRL